MKIVNMHIFNKNNFFVLQKREVFYAFCTKNFLFLLHKILTIVIVNDILTKNSEKYVFFCAYVYVINIFCLCF